jgi:error-prone DNA polymerase
VVLVRQRPSTASGVVFMTIEDETGVANLIFRPEVFERFRRAARHGTCLFVRGRVERQGEVVHVNVRKVIDLTHELDGLARTSRDFH